MVKRALSLENATPKQILQYRTEQAIKKYQRHPLDCGNAAIQCALMSEKIILLMKHVKNYPRDKRTGRFLAELIQKRRNMLSYCMRTDYHRYKWVCVDYGIPDEHPRNSHHKECFGNHFNNFRTDRWLFWTVTVLSKIKWFGCFLCLGQLFYTCHCF